VFRSAAKLDNLAQRSAGQALAGTPVSPDLCGSAATLAIQLGHVCPVPGYRYSAAPGGDREEDLTGRASWALRRGRLCMLCMCRRLQL